MATSTNYGWSEPDNTSLVKDGAQAMRTLGDAIDVSLWNSGFGQAGKNKLINGDFSINQRAFTSNTASGSYNFDRWVQANGGTTGTLTTTPQTFTPGAAPVAGYEGKNYVQCVTAAGASTNTIAIFIQRMEDVRTFAGQTVTISFWAKATSGTPKIATEFVQSFGAGGSPSADVFTYAGQSTLSTSWARYSVTVNAPSISGKTIGTTANSSFASIQFWLSGGSDFNSRTGSMGLQNNTFHMWGIQVEYGSKATPFQTASGGSPQAELAMCQRYYYKATLYQTGFPAGTTDNNRRQWIQFPVTMRTTPSSYSITVDTGTPTADQATTAGFRALSAVGNTTTVAYFGTVEASAEL